MQNQQLHPVSLLLLRVLGSLIFITAGLNHLLRPQDVAARLELAANGHWATWMAMPSTLVIGAGIGLLSGGLALLLGYRTRLAAAGLLLILLPITLTVQVGNPAGMGPLFKNVALAGMLLFFLLNGAVYYSLDQWTAARNWRKVVGLGVMLSVAALTLLAPQPGAASDLPEAVVAADSTRIDYAVLVSQPDHLKATLHTARTLTAEAPYHRREFVVMACGKSVEAFVAGHALQQTIEEGLQAGITYRVCGLSLEKFQIDQSRLIGGVNVIPNGLTHMFDLKRAGYITVEL